MTHEELVPQTTKSGAHIWTITHNGKTKQIKTPAKNVSIINKIAKKYEKLLQNLASK